MKYVITGATSFIGIELTELLLGLGHSVVAVCRPESKSLSGLPSSAGIVMAGMEDYHSLDSKISSADVFVNLAWNGTGHDGRDAAAVQEDNVRHTGDAMAAALRMGCKLFVEAGSQAEYGSTMEPQTEESECHPFSEYGKAKLRVKDMGFDLAGRSGMKYLHLRIFSVFGENDHPWTLVMSSLDRMLASEQVDLSPCTQNWNFVYVKDAVGVIAGLCRHAVENSGFRHEIYNVASKDTRVLKEFVEEMKELAHSESVLNYGAVIPANMVSLQPCMDKTISASGFEGFHRFDDVVSSIIAKKNNKGI